MGLDGLGEAGVLGYLSADGFYDFIGDGGMRNEKFTLELEYCQIKGESSRHKGDNVRIICKNFDRETMQKGKVILK